MPNYRRWFRPGGTYFFTLVTYERRPILGSPVAQRLLREAIETCRRRMPFDIDAAVLLPDHWHAVLTLPDGDQAYPARLGLIKKTFTQGWLAAGGDDIAVSESKTSDRRRGVWQRRFWEHVVRDADDLQRCADYVHYNPVKHGYARCPHGWAESSLARWVGRGVYPADWYCTCDGRQPPDPPEEEGFEGCE